MKGRTMERREIRATRPMEIRTGDGDSDGMTLVGYASVFDADYDITDALGTYTERVAPGAFTRTLDHGADVRLLVNHDGVPLARTKSGTLLLNQDDTGLAVEARLDPDNPLAVSVRSAMDRGDMDEMSFAFKVTRQDWSDDYTDRTIREVQLFDVSVVTFPANPATTATLRSAAAARGVDLDELAARYGYDVDADAVRQVLRGEPAPHPTNPAVLRLRAAALGL